MKEIPLTQGKVAIVDDEDFERLNQFKWFAVKEKDGQIYYAARNIRKLDGSRQMSQMHRELLSVVDPVIKVDHADGDGLNNRRFNLRAATNALNIANSRKRRNCTSQFKGVHLEARAKTNPWRSVVGGKSREHLGSFPTEEAAARAYDAAAIRHFGPFAKLNFPI